MATRYNYTGGIVTDGLVLHLDAAKRDSYPGSGTTWYDLSGNGHHAVLENGAAISDTGTKSQNILTDGSNDKITISNHSNLTPTTNFTVALWFYGNPNQGGRYGGLFNKDGNGDFGSWGIYGDINNNYVRFGYKATSGTQIECSNQTYTDIDNASWYNYCGTFDGTHLRLYRNGTEIATNLNVSATHNTPETNSYNVGLGYRPGSNNYLLSHNYAIAMFYRAKTLTAAEVLQNYNAQKGRYGL